MSLANLSQLQGHTAARSALGSVLAQQQVGHAYLFEGPPGVGKRVLGEAFLARLTCLDAPATEADSCGRCRSCVAWQRGDHPDFQLVSRDGAFIKIEQVRAVTSRLQFDPVLGATKVVLVEDAEHLHEAAANALLKTLEEPPARSCFVLTSSQSQRLLHTIRSRCQTLRLGPLAPAEIAAVLALEGQAPAQARLAAGLAQGSLHDARRLCDPRRQRLVVELVQSVCKVEQFEVAALVEQMLQAWAQARQTLRDDDEDDDEDDAAAASGGSAKAIEFSATELVETLGVLRSALRDAMLLASDAPHHLVVHRDALAALAGLGQRLGPLRLASLLDALDATEDQQVYNTPPRVLLMGWLAQLRASALLAPD